MARRLGLPLAPALPARLCPLPSPLYRVLLGYKESPVAEARERFGAIVRALLSEFLVRRAGAVRAALGGAVESVLVVPSSLRPGPPPLARVAGLVDEVLRALPGARWASWTDQAEHTRDGARRRSLGHMRPDAAVFELGVAERARVAGTRALLVDDTYVSGARAQSAAAALRLAGVRAVLIVPLGRVLRPDRVPLHADFLCRSDVVREQDGPDGPVGSGRAVVTSRPSIRPRREPRRTG